MLHPNECSSPSNSSSGDTLIFAIHYPPNCSKPQILNLSPPVVTSSSTFPPTMTNTVLDLSSVVSTADLEEIPQPLDLSTPTSRENLTLASSLQSSAPVPTSTAEVIDPNVAVATLSAVSSGSITPLIKEELKCTIQQKRLSNGEDELVVQHEQQKLPSKLSPAEEDRRIRRRERNRIAAQRCRSRRKEKADDLIGESEVLEKGNQNLRDEIEKLEEEKEKLEHMMRLHDLIPRPCNKKLSVSSDDTEAAPGGSCAPNGSMEYEVVIESMDPGDDNVIMDQVL